MGDRRIAQHPGARPGAITLIKTSERNVASQRVAKRAEFVREAVLEDGRIDPDGHPSRTMLYVRRNPA
jgi:RimJ/RimL family protein N-acetyltransferase